MEPEMPAFDYDQLSLEELEQIEKEVKKAIASYHDRKRKEAIAKMNEVAKELGFSSATEALGAEPTKKRKPTSDPIYRHPKNHALTWGNQGRRPNWFNKAKEEEGYTEDELLIANQ